MPHRPPAREISKQRRRMQALCDAFDLGDDDVAKRLEVNRTTVWRWRNGVSAMGKAQWALLTSTLNLSPDWMPK